MLPGLWWLSQRLPQQSEDAMPPFLRFCLSTDSLWLRITTRLRPQDVEATNPRSYWVDDRGRSTHGSLDLGNS